MVSFAHIPADTEITVVASTGSDITIVPDDRASTEIDAFGGQLDDYPDGKIVGAFGDMSGARPDVWICPLQRQEDDDPNEVCSTFAYKWSTGTIAGAITGLRKGDKATVTLTPVNSNEDYEDDLEDEAKITAGTGGAAKYSFTGVADGRYMVTLAANKGSWEEDESKVLSVMHDEDNDEDDYTGDTAGEDLSATDLRGVIRGRIANDSNGRSGLTSDESRAGVMVALYTAKKVGGSGTTKNNYVADEPVTDDDDDPVMAETDREGVYMFEGLVVGDMYLVKPKETDLYTAVRNGNPKIGKTAEEADDIVPHALVEAGLPPKEGSEPAIPTWDYHTSTATPGGDANFVLLYKDGEVEGEVSDPSIRAAHERTVIELHQCLTTNFDDNDTPDDTTDDTAASQCSTYTDVVMEAEVDEDGDWSAEDLREGYYEVIPDLPAGYISVTEEGSTTVDDPVTLFSQQLVMLVGGRADDDTETFHIKDRNAGAEATLTSVEIDGDACTMGSADNPADNNCGHADDGEFSVVATASDDATIRLSSSATDDSPTGTGTYSYSVRNGKSTTITLPKAGSRRFFVHVSAEDGYASNSADVATAAGFHLRRDADVRVEEVTISWSGDRIELDREALDLDPDGETDPVTGTTVMRVTVDKGDNGGTIPTTDLSVTASGMTTGFGVAGFGTVDVTATPIACSSADFTGLAGTTTGTLTLPANVAGPPAVKGSDGVCFRIADTDGDATNPDANAANNRDYILIITRK